VRAQLYDLPVYGTENGLPGMVVNDITQDSLGYLWLATNDGVSRFDGIRFVNYFQRNGLASNQATTVFCDAENRIWVGHQAHGISVITPDSTWTITENDGLANNEVHDIYQGADGRIWVATFGGLSVFDGTQWSTLTAEDGLTSSNIRCVSGDDQGRIWAGTFGSGLCVVSGKLISVYHVGNGLANNHVTDLLFRKGNMLISTLGGLSIWKDGKFTNTASLLGLSNNQINRASVNRKGDIWLATYNGAIRIRDGKVLSLNEQNGLPSNEVLCCFSGFEGNTWLGTKKGLIKVRNIAFTHFFSNDEIDVEPSVIFTDSKGRVWAGNEAGGVLKYDGYSFVKAFNDPDINDRQISSVAEDGNGNLWFGTMDFGGLFQWNGSRLFVYSDEFGLADNNINCLMTNNNGELLIGTPNGLSIYDGSDFRIIPLSEDGNDHVTAMHLAQDGAALIGTSLGTLFRIKDDGSVSKVPLECSSPITDLDENSLGALVTTQGDGLFIVGAKGTLHVDDESGLKTSSLRSVTTLNDRIYLGTTQGMERIWFENDTVIVRQFDSKDGFLGNACKRACMLADGASIWVGTSKGITLFTPLEEHLNVFEPKTFLTDLQLFYKQVDWARLNYETDKNGLPQNLVLPYSQNYLRFHFKGINLSEPEGVTYRWKLEGFENDWNPYSDQEQVSYPNLDPGDYTFLLVACNSEGVCNSEPVRFSFSITPPIWRTWGFYAFIGVLGLALTYVFIKRRERILIQEKQILEETVAERTKELREQKEIVEAQNTHITESIEYARNIQMAILPSASEFIRAFNGHFVFYRPKEAVGGDFYWVHSHGHVSWVAAVDCTGHGVAGAFMSMIGSDLLNQIIIEKKVDDPAKVLDEMDKGIKLAFGQSAKEFESDQGMDMALIRIDRKTRKLEFAGAQRPLYIMHNGTLLNLEGNRHSISCAVQRNAESFSKYTFEPEGPAVAYLFTDGIVDQFGGEQGKKFMIRRLRDWFEEHGGSPMSEQLEAINATFDQWRGTDYEQVDDVTLIGIQL
jgi:ligand-binding sensor domain-containing protein/serine phosphatase RsbU (regulator of sigma subunit)